MKHRALQLLLAAMLIAGAAGLALADDREMDKADTSSAYSGYDLETTPEQEGE